MTPRPTDWAERAAAFLDFECVMADHEDADADIDQPCRECAAAALREAYEEGRRAGLEQVQALVNEQAEDEGLWFAAEHAPEAYLQSELRRLHGVVEGLTQLDVVRALAQKEEPKP